MKNPNDDDVNIRAAFDALRSSEHRVAPDFQTSMERSRAKARGPATPWAMPALALGAVAVGVLLLALAGGWMGGSPVESQTPRLAEALPSFLEANGSETGAGLFTSLPAATEYTPTDFLLPNQLTIDLF